MRKVATMKIMALASVVLLMGIIGGIILSHDNATKPEEKAATTPAGAPSPGPAIVAAPAD